MLGRTFMCLCWCAHLCAYVGVHIYALMFVCNFMFLCWCAHLCAYVCAHIYVLMLVRTFMCLCWCAHLLAYVDVHIYYLMLVCTFMCLCWCATRLSWIIPNSTITQLPVISYKLCCAAQISRSWFQLFIRKLRLFIAQARNSTGILNVSRKN